MNVETNSKVLAHHLKRNAYLYIRQSTIRQVMENQESTKRQYNLQQRAIALGWNEDQVHIIDSDLGESGASTTRDGFRSLITEVSMGRAGIVMGLEVSRLARNSSDWHRLLEICALSHTLILDEEGVYDPAHFNDRLLLGLKGTMSEAELYVIKSRLFGGILNKAKRGELRLRLPVGYVYSPHSKIVMDSDKRVKDAENLLFKTFRQTGTAGGTVREFARQGILFPKMIFSGPKKGELVFGKLTASRTFQILRNPRYAGAYAFGVRQQFTRAVEPQMLVKYVEQEQWKAFLKDSHDGYISWPEYEENLQRLADNATAKDTNRRCPPREGPALLQGLAVCSDCGRKMTIRYHTRRGQIASPDYVCVHATSAIRCQTIPGTDIDKLIERLLLEKVSPATIEVAMSVQEELQARVDEANQIRYRYVESAKYEMEVAKKHYMVVDPENRLVADDLESTWNEKIRIYRECSEHYERKKSEDQLKITDEQRRRVSALVAEFTALWSSQTTDDRDRKRMVRLLISDVTLNKMDRDIKVQIRYKGGATEEHLLARPKSAWEEKRHSSQVIAEIDRLLDHHTDGQIAELMNSNGFVSGTGKLFDARRVSIIRRAYRLKSLETRLRHRGLFTIKEICEKYDLSRHAVYELRRSGRLKAYRYDDVGRHMYELTDENAFTTMSRGSAV